MALCHDERDFAMGFSRHDPHAGKRLHEIRSKGTEERRKYLESLTPHQKRACERVKFCLQAVGQYLVARGDMVNISPRELHKLFPAFAKEMGYRGPFYQLKDEKCLAIGITYPTSTDGSIWILHPYIDYDRLDEKARKRVHTKKARRAALNFCRAWMADWKWNEVKLP